MTMISLPLEPQRTTLAGRAVHVRYLRFLVGCLCAVTVPFFVWALTGKDHFAAIPRAGDARWYRNYDDATTRAIQDRDVMYHNVGRTIENARAADIILLGHSMVLWGLRDDQLEEFGRQHGVKIFNMASAGDGSGEFLRRVVKRWDLKPKLWIINADDHAANFFNVSLDDFGGSGVSAAPLVVKYGRFHGFMNVIGRDFRWRLEDLVVHNLPVSIGRLLLPNYPGMHVYRSAVTGSWDLSGVPVYNDPANPVIELERDQNCPAKPDEIERARNYAASIGGTVMLTLFPYSESCPQRVREIAAALDMETILPPDVHYTSHDKAHLDRRGATAFTSYFLNALAQTEAFKKIGRP